MTLQQALSDADERCPNTVPRQTKIRWLGELDWDLYRSILLTHAGEDIRFRGYRQDLTEEAGAQIALIAPEPFDGMYPVYLESRIHYENGEIPRYNNANALFRERYESYRSWYNRTHLPLARAVRFF